MFIAQYKFAEYKLDAKDNLSIVRWNVIPGVEHYFSTTDMEGTDLAVAVWLFDDEISDANIRTLAPKHRLATNYERRMLERKLGLDAGKSSITIENDTLILDYLFYDDQFTGEHTWFSYIMKQIEPGKYDIVPKARNLYFPGNEMMRGLILPCLQIYLGNPKHPKSLAKLALQEKITL